MITYATDRWHVFFACSLKGSVFPKAFVFAFLSSIFAVALHIIFHFSEDMSKAVGAGDVGASILGGFAFILGFLVVFRSQQAYSRWWEGGALMQQLRGEWFNAASCLFAFSSTCEDKKAEVLKFQHQLVRLVSLLYGSALAQVAATPRLPGQDSDKLKPPCQVRRFPVISLSGFDPEGLKFLESELCHDPCEVVLQWIQRLITHADATGVIKIAPPILSRVFNQLGNGIVNLNNARKITEFPIPFPLAQMITVMLLFHGLATPLICATTIETPYWAGFLCFVVVFSYWTINYIATELEMPFGDDANDLPLHDMQCDLNESLMTLLREEAMFCPNFTFDPDRDTNPEIVSIDFDKGILRSFVECGTSVPGGRWDSAESGAEQERQLEEPLRELYCEMPNGRDEQDVPLTGDPASEDPQDWQHHQECSQQCHEKEAHLELCQVHLEDTGASHLPPTEMGMSPERSINNQPWNIQVSGAGPSPAAEVPRAASTRRPSGAVACQHRNGRRASGDMVIEIRAASACCLPFASHSTMRPGTGPPSSAASTPRSSRRAELHSY